MRRFDRDFTGGFLTSISPVFGLGYYITLATQTKEIVSGIRKDSVTAGALIGLLVVGVISSLLSPSVGESLVTSLVLPLFIVFYSLGRWGIKNPRPFLRAVVYGAGFLGLICIIARLMRVNIYLNDFPILASFHTSHGRGNVLGMGSNGLAAMLEVGVVGGIGLFLVNERNRWLYLVSAFTSLIGVFITLSRGAMVGTAFAILVLFVLQFKELRRYWKMILLFLIIASLLVTFLPGLGQRVVSIFDVEENRSNTIRLTLWETSLEMIKDHPFFGLGPGRFSEEYFEYDTPKGFYPATPHSLYFFVALGWGLLGFALFFGWIFLRTVVPAIRERSPYRIVALAMIASFFAHVFFDDLFVAHVPLLMGLIAREDVEVESE